HRVVVYRRHPFLGEPLGRSRRSLGRARPHLPQSRMDGTDQHQVPGEDQTRNPGGKESESELAMRTIISIALLAILSVAASAEDFLEDAHFFVSAGSDP